MFLFLVFVTKQLPVVLLDMDFDLSMFLYSTVALLTSKNNMTINCLFQEAEALVSQKIHPQTIIQGWRKATDVARKALTDFARDHG